MTRDLLPVAFSLAVTASAGCLFAESVNNPPALSPIEGPDHVRRNQDVMFHATSSDSDSVIRWKQSAECPTADSAADVRMRALAENWLAASTFTARSDGPAFCVTAVAIDGRGAATIRTKQINVANSGLTIDGPSSTARNVLTSYTATLRVDGLVVVPASISWAVANGECPAQTADVLALVATFPSQSGATATVTATTVGALCLAAVAADSEGGKDVATKTILTTNQAPVVQRLTFQGDDSAVAPAVPRLTKLRIEAEATDEDDDSLSYGFRVVSAEGKAVTTAACEDAARCVSVTIDTPGTYKAEVIAKDPLSAPSAPRTRTFYVVDAAPCLSNLTPAEARIFRTREEGWLTFRVDRVKDDADPVPAVNPARSSGAGFFWYSSVATAMGASVNPTLNAEHGPSFALDLGRFRAGDVVDVRVEYHDELDASKALLSEPLTTAVRVGDEPPAPRTECGAAPTTCGPASCRQRQSWRVEIQ